MVMTMSDARVEKTILSVKEALLRLLTLKAFDSVSMSDIAREAGISRSTLYAHFSNPLMIFDLLVADFHQSIRELGVQLKCTRCGKEADKAGIPYCEAIRNAGKYEALVRDPNYEPRMIEVVSQGLFAEQALRSYVDAGLDRQIAVNIFTFQMCGCYNAAISVKEEKEWMKTQEAIDAFIKGGLRTIRTELS